MCVGLRTIHPFLDPGFTRNSTEKVGNLAAGHFAGCFRDRPSCGCASCGRMEGIVSLPILQVHKPLIVYSGYSIHIRSMTTGRPHPAAEFPSFCWRDTGRVGPFSVYYPSLTSSRLAVLVDPGSKPPGLTMVVWDWTTGRVLLVSKPLSSVLTFDSTRVFIAEQERTDRIYKSLVFVNEHSFAVLSDDLQGRKDPYLHIFDTGRGKTLQPVQTSFLFPIDHMGTPLRLLSEPYSHAPLPDELLLEPFYQDPSQRILAIHDGWCWLDVINVELLLELARKREGQNIGWGEWGPNTTRIQVRDRDQRIWVSGCRVFCAVPAVDDESEGISYLQIYDLSRRGRSKHVHAMDISSAVGGGGRILPSVDGCELPWVPNEIDGGTRTIGNYGIAFCVVSALKFTV